MGGLFIVAALVASVLLFGDPRNGYVVAGLLVAGGMTVVGIVDDLVKLRSAAKGLSVRRKLVAQVAVAAAGRHPALPATGGRGRRPAAARARHRNGRFAGVVVHPPGLARDRRRLECGESDRWPGRLGRRLPAGGHRAP